MIDPESKPPEDKLLSEAQCMRIIANAFACAGIALDASDDCGMTHGATDLVTTDSLIEGHHFDQKHDTPEQIGRQAAIVNLSDLAGSGAEAGWLVWALSLNSSWDEASLSQLAYGFGSEAAKYGASVLGGNLAYTNGPTVIGVTAGGALAGERPLLRTDARPGDAVYISGILGRATLGYLKPTQSLRLNRHQWRPHLAESAALSDIMGVHACMDISDGLLKDAGRMASASALAIHLESNRIPCVGEQYTAMTGGEDYVLLFTAPPEIILPKWAIRIGACHEGEGVYLDDDPTLESGYDHFAGRG